VCEGKSSDTGRNSLFRKKMISGYLVVANKGVMIVPLGLE